MNMIFWRDLVDLEFIISMSTILFYSWILIVMARSRSSVFRSAFFRIFIVTGVFDIQGIAVAEWIRAEFRVGFGPDYEIFTRIICSFTGSHFFIHIFGCLIMTINRYTAVCYPEIYAKCWNSKTVNFILLIEIAIAFVAHTQLFFIPFGYQWKDDRWFFMGRTRPVPFIRIMSTSVVIVYSVASIILIALTIRAISKLSQLKGKTILKESGLVIMMAIDVFLGIVDCVYEASDLFGSNKGNNPVINWISSHFCLFFFMIVSMNAYSIVVMSSDTRKALLYSLRFPCCCGNQRLEKRMAFSTISSSRHYR